MPHSTVCCGRNLSVRLSVFSVCSSSVCLSSGPVKLYDVLTHVCNDVLSVAQSMYFTCMNTFLTVVFVLYLICCLIKSYFCFCVCGLFMSSQLMTCSSQPLEEFQLDKSESPI
ncbi:hypothetical protein XENOCAPTIV_022849 [Xenoophorus captivus]|uniref:Uncharacterized protein n=1 Tax=Xenoophorus captivus TaxID=1517983 RepID=A0ABV0QKW7_9TELE